MVVFQSVWGQLLDAVTLGVIFARISHPKQRARTIFISDSAVIARRDGVLKFMFRIGDVRSSQASCSCLCASMESACVVWRKALLPAHLSNWCNALCEGSGYIIQASWYELWQRRDCQIMMMALRLVG